MSRITVEALNVGYQDKTVIHSLDAQIHDQKITTIIGPNGCGKSTLLKTVSRLIKPNQGFVYLDGKSIHQEPTKKLAKHMAIMPQSPTVPEGLTVYELISYGRYPHQSGFKRLSKEDQKMIEWAMDVTGVKKFADKEVDALSGGQRQKVWIALTLAQETEIILLDEPTTYLDMAHQLDVLQLLKRLNKLEKRTIVMVLHDLNHAARFSDYLITMRDGSIIKTGTPKEVMSSETLRQVYEIEARIIHDEKTGYPICVSYDLCDDCELYQLAGQNTILAQ